jgi:hypothetical protein
MSEIEKLRKRLKNVEKSVTTYNMTVVEARALESEFNALEKVFNDKELELKAEIEKWKLIGTLPHAPSTPIVRNLDGGTF